MKTNQHPSDSLWPAPWPDALRKTGFMPANGCWRQNGLAFSRADQWFMMESRSIVEREISLLAQLGQRGLWRWIPADAGRVRVFEFPDRVVSPADDDVEADQPTLPESFLHWAVAAHSGELPDGWQAPGRELIESWLSPGGLTVQCGPFVRQGELTVTPEQWAVRVPILPRLPTDLPTPRRQWLDAVLTDALKQWRMVRIGLTSDRGYPALIAEVDFTGAPHSEILFSVGLASVRHVVTWLAESVELLADASVASELLAGPPPEKPETERNAV